jgi:biopolymer transport protein ExbB
MAMTFFSASIERFLDFIALGGPVVAILLAVSAIALAVILLKLGQFANRQVGNGGAARKAISFWLDGRPREAFEAARKSRAVSAQAAAEAIRLAGDRNAAKADIEDRIAALAMTRFHELQSGFRLLDAIAQVAPLLGLFGTVLGMINAFQQLQAAGNSVDPSILAGGIWVALLTTAAGLAVAMPVSMVLTWLETRIEAERVLVQTLTADILGLRPASKSVSDVELIRGDAAVAH